MRGAIACLPLALLFIANVVPAKAQKAAQAGDEEVEVRVREGAPLELTCSLRVEQRAEWRRDGGALPAGLVSAGEAPAPGRRPGAAAAALTVRLQAAAARPQHAGVYACARGPGAQRLRVVVESASAPAETTTAAAATPAAADARPADAGSDANIHYFDLARLNNFTLTCPFENPGKLGYVWKVNGSALEDAVQLRGRHRLDAGGAQFVLEARTVEDDWGTYACALAPGAAFYEWHMHARAVAKIPPNTNVVEGQKLKLVCRVIGKPPPPVEWRYRNESADAPAAGVEVTDPAALGERAKLNASEAHVEGAQLVLDAAQLADAGQYTCVPLGPLAGRAAAGAATTTLRVKDMYAALWPFLGICAEVLVLCVVILVYEKRRTKPELDDSDTDNHDQKKS